MATVPASSSFILPQEIVNAVIDQLYADGDVHSLALVGLVSQMWYPRTRDHLFYSLNIPCPEVYDKGNGVAQSLALLESVVKGRPELLQRVRRALVVGLDVACFACCPWFKDSLIGILRGLTSIDLLGIVGNAKAPRPHWDRIPDIVRDALWEMLTRNGMSVMLDRIDNFPVSRLFECGSFLDLALHDLQAAPAQTDEVDGPLRLALSHSSAKASLHRHLRGLTVRACGQALQALQRRNLAIHPRYLCVNTTGWTEEMSDVLPYIVHTGGDTVTYYTIQQHTLPALPVDTAFLSPLFDIAQLPKLEVLKLTTSSSMLSQHSHNPLLHLISSLDRRSTLNFGSALAEIDIVIRFDPIHPSLADFFERLFGMTIVSQRLDPERRERVQLCADKAVWKQLDEVLARPTFSRLRSLSVSFVQTKYPLPEDAWLQLRDDVLGSMEELHGRRRNVHCVKL